MIKYTTEIPEDRFHHFCRIHRIDRGVAIKGLREAAIGAAENEINTLLLNTYKGLK